MAIARGVDFLPSQIWEALMHHCSADVLVEVTSPLITPWLSLLVTPTSLPVDSSLLVGSLAQPSVSCVCVCVGVGTCIRVYVRTCVCVCIVHAYMIVCAACESECVCLHGSILNTSTDANTCVCVCDAGQWQC